MNTAPPRRIAVGVDGSEQAKAALAWALLLATAVGAEVIVVHGQGLLESGGLVASVDLERIVAEVGGGAPGDATPPTVTVMRPGPGADALIAVAEEHAADLIVVGRRGMGATPRLLGSTSEQVLNAATVPVVVLPSVG